MYAADRVKPPVPERPDEKDDKVLEESKAQKSKIEEKKAASHNEDEINKHRSDQVINEFNSLANLIGPSDSSG